MEKNSECNEASVTTRRALPAPAKGSEPASGTPVSENKNQWVLTGTGRVVDLLAPRPEMISLEDIARQLSRMARFCGATRGYSIYSVAQHCVLVSQIAQDLSDDPLAPRYGLLHDAHEAYMGDITSPVKQVLGAVGLLHLNQLQLALDAAIYEYFNLPPISHELALVVKQADMIALATERRDLMPSGGPDWQLGVEPLSTDMADALPIELAYARFMDRFVALSKDISAAAIEQRTTARRALDGLTADSR